VPLDRHGEWYRYHQLFRDMLLAAAPLTMISRQNVADILA
jgi:ATP/maltotriose-dependent transcriptional regulator MalT